MLRSTLFITLLTFSLAGCQLTSSQQKDNAKEVKPHYQFKPNAELNNHIEQKKKQALSSNKHLLLVLGAEWCHDSRSLATQFSQDKFEQQLKQKFEILFVDVGYLESEFELTQRFGQASYYGTPTVLIIDPQTDKLLNRYSHKQWMNAALQSSKDYQQYFIEKDFAFPQVLADSQKYQQYLQLIDEFELTQSKKLRRGYNVVGPMLRDFKKSGDKKPSEEFNQKWAEVRLFRSHLADDMQKLLEKARTFAVLKINKPLTFPQYENFSWEN